MLRKQINNSKLVKLNYFNFDFDLYVFSRKSNNFFVLWAFLLV